MRISTPPISANSVELAEWLELIALTRENGTSSEADLRALLEGPAGDIALYEGNQSEQDEALELLVQEVFDELDDRRRWAGRGYPFEMEPLNVLRLKDRLRYAGIAYLLSLLISFLKRFKEEELAKEAFPNRGELEDLFQICGTIAAAGFVSGSSVSFGFPRLDSTPFYQKLDQVRDHLGEGEPKLGWDVGASPNPADAGVDTIAWRECPDRFPGQLYLLGQCATGKTWQTEKDPLPDYDDFHEYYWLNKPHSPLLAATFVPFDLRESVSQGKYASLEEAYRWERWELTKRFGVVLDRFRLAYYFSEGLARTICTRSIIEGRKELKDVRNWVQSGITFLQQEHQKESPLDAK